MFVYNTFRPDIRVLKEAQSLAKAGWSVKILALAEKGAPHTEEFDGVIVHRLSRSGAMSRRPPDAARFENAQLGSNGSRPMEAFLSIARRARRMGLHLIRPLWRLQRFLGFYRACYRYARRAPAHVYHAHDLNTLPAAWWCKRRIGGKLVYDAHELFTECSWQTGFSRKLWTLLERRLIRDCNRVITVCGSIADELLNRYGIDPPVVVRNCPLPPKTPISRHRSHLRNATGIRDDVPLILYHGGFLPNRGLRNLFKAVPHFDHGSLVMMGWGKMEAELRALADALKLNDRIHFLPPVPQEDLIAWTASADIGIIPYRAVGLNNYYSCPNKLFEYVNAGLAVAGSAFPEIRKIIEEYDIGATFDPEEPVDIARALNYMLNDDHRLQQQKENAGRAAAVLNWHCEAEQLIDLYAGLDITENQKASPADQESRVSSAST